MEPKLTVKDVLKDVLNLLNDVKVPISEIETIGIPVGRAINGIKICIEAFERDDLEKAKQEAEKAKQDGKKVELHLVEDQEDSNA